MPESCHCADVYQAGCTTLYHSWCDTFLLYLFNAAGSVLLVSFLLAVLKYVDGYFSTGISPALDAIALFLLPLVIIIVLIAGYVSIFAGLKSPKPDPSQDARPSKTPENYPSWETIGEEFRQMVADIIRKLRNEIHKD